jgi:hypothetical protein
MIGQTYARPRPGGLGRFLFLPLFIVIGFVATAWLAGSEEADTKALFLLILLTMLALVIFSRASRNDPDRLLLYQVLVLAWLAKLATVGAKLYLLYNVYGGADALQYHRAGEDIAAMLAMGGIPDLARFWGTRFIELSAGALYFFTGPTFVGSWFVWAFLGSMGMLFQYKAFVTACPTGHRRLFMVLIFFYPSILMWTNALGKDAIMAFFLGMAAYGAALIYRRGLDIGSMFWTAVGIAGAFAVRPHLGAIVAVALVAVIVLRPIRAGMFTPLIRLATLAGVIAMAAFIAQTSASFVGLEDLSVEGVTDYLGTEQQQTQQGSGAFETGLPTTPQGAALAVLSVLFRPFPWEAHNLLARVSAMEGMALIGMAVWRFRSIVSALRAARRNAYLGFTVVYVPLFVFFFSAISNFGILARQRIQVLPFLFVWLAYLGTRQDLDNAAAQGDVHAS